MDKKKTTAPLVCHGHSRPVVDLFYSPITPDGFFLISASKDSNPMLRNGETGDWIGTFQGHKGAVWSSCLDKPALRAASASADFSAKLWNALTGDELHSFEHKHIVRACAFSEDTHLLLTGGFEKILRIYDLNRLDAPPMEVDKSPGSVRTLAWLHSDQMILSSCTDMGGVRLWDVRSGKIVQTLETKSAVTSAEVSRDGRYITTADGSTVKFWDANHFGLVKSYDMPCNVESASLEPRFGNKFVAGGEDMWLHVFDFHTGSEIACNKGHHGPVHCVRFSPGGESYASGSEDGTIRIWQTLNHNGEETTMANGPIENVKDAAEEVTQKVEGLNLADEKKPVGSDRVTAGVALARKRLREKNSKASSVSQAATGSEMHKEIVEGGGSKEVERFPIVSDLLATATEEVPVIEIVGSSSPSACSSSKRVWKRSKAPKVHIGPSTWRPNWDVHEDSRYSDDDIPRQLLHGLLLPAEGGEVQKFEKRNSVYLGPTANIPGTYHQLVQFCKSFVELAEAHYDQSSQLLEAGLAVAHAESELRGVRTEHAEALGSLEALKAFQEEVQERYQQSQLHNTELKEEVQKLKESLVESKRVAVEEYKSSSEYQDALIEQTGEDYALGYNEAKRDIGVAYPNLDLSRFPAEDKDDSPATPLLGTSISL